jgi:hypothetical protein
MITFQRFRRATFIADIDPSRKHFGPLISSVAFTCKERGGELSTTFPCPLFASG